MAFCTQCGVILHDDDALKHICKAKPEKGKEWQPQKTISDVV